MPLKLRPTGLGSAGIFETRVRPFRLSLRLDGRAIRMDTHTLPLKLRRKMLDGCRAGRRRTFPEITIS